MNYRNISIFLSLTCITILLCGSVVFSAEQYKKHARDAISQVVDGNLDSALKHFENYLKNHPNDLESLYGMAVVYAQKKDITNAMEYAKQAVGAGLPFGRFLAGPRGLLKPLTNSAGFKQLAKEHAAATELLHGPMLGCLTDTSAKFWVRTANEVSVQVVICELENRESVFNSAVVRTNKDRDFTAVLTVKGLKPDTRYWYTLFVNNVGWSIGWPFKTFPKSGKKAKFKIGFGGGAGYSPMHEKMWNTIAAHNLTAFLFLGDNVYIDNPTRPAVQQYCYYRRQSRPEFRSLTASTAIYAIWDDHDFTTNDGWGGPQINKPSWKMPVWNVFHRNWNNPYYGGGEKQPGCWFDFSIGDVDFFMLDGRFYRTNPKGRNPSMLGPAQKDWLFTKLKASKATFKMLVSPVPWAFGAKPGSLDAWEGYKQERKEIFSFLQDNKIDGVVLLSADRHRSDAWKIKRDNAYDLYEFESSKLTNIHTHRLITSALFGYNTKCSFGLLSFDTTISDPEVTYKIVSIDNEVIHTLTIKKTQLTHRSK